MIQRREEEEENIGMYIMQEGNSEEKTKAVCASGYSAGTGGHDLRIGNVHLFIHSHELRSEHTPNNKSH